MARTIPSPTSGRTIPTPAAGGGGPATNPWKDWVELPLDPTDGWTQLNGLGAVGATVAKVGSNLEVTFPGGQNIQWTGATKRGIALVRNIHLQPWADNGLVLPAGQSSYSFQPEAFLLKLEVQFDPDEPIDGEAGNSYGYRLQCTAGMFHYASDQSGSPVMPGAEENCGGVVYKNGTADPQVSTSTSEFKAGYNNYTGRGVNTGLKWRCQPGMAATGHDTLFYIGGLPSGTVIATLIQAQCSGSYADQDPFAIAVSNGYTNQSNSTKFAGTRYCHIALNFGAWDGTTSRAGTFKIKRIRYILQPLENRSPPTPA